MRLGALHVENFRALEKMTIPFSPMTVIIGENDVGRTHWTTSTSETPRSRGVTESGTGEVVSSAMKRRYSSLLSSVPYLPR